MLLSLIKCNPTNPSSGQSRLFKGERLLLVAAWLAVAGFLPGATRPEHVLSSPDGRLRVSLVMPTPGSMEHPYWSATFRGNPILAKCRLGLQTAEAGDLLAGAHVLESSTRSVDESVPMPFGKFNQARNRFHQIRYTLEAPQHHRVVVVFRCFDDAVALRYELPADGKTASMTVTNEATSFALVGEPSAYVQYLESFKTSHEHLVAPTTYRDIQRDALLDMPLTFLWKDNTCAAITEAALRQYAGMALMRPASAPNRDALVCRLTPRPDGTLVARPLPMRTPWRVVLIGDRPGALLESTTIYCLNEPSAIKDPSWIRPGKITFSWWNGDVYDGQPGLPILSIEMAKKYIDFCARHSLPFHSLTSTETPVTPWYVQSNPSVNPGPDTDVTRPRPGFDLGAIRRYADAKQVRLWTWVHQAALRGRVDEAFAAFAKLGWTGMMVDFFDHDDQDAIEFAEAIIEAAARHHILIHLHGVWKPTGLERMYPNLMNHEGALNLEYLKWSDLCTPEHNLKLAFTRLVAGPMDYHLGGFRSVLPAQFESRNVAPNVLGTRAHMLAMYVCFDNPTPMVADYPTAYEGQPGFDFLKLVPTWWDETRVLEGQIGELLVTARRKDSTWYVGALSAKGPRHVRLPLSFLGSARHTAKLWKDAPEAATDPNRLNTQALLLSPTDTLEIDLALDGGFVAELTPQRAGNQPVP